MPPPAGGWGASASPSAAAASDRQVETGLPAPTRLVETVAPFAGPGGGETDTATQGATDFELLRRLGSGSFGQVFLARQQSLGRLVAVKLSPNQGSEARTLA